VDKAKIPEQMLRYAPLDDDCQEDRRKEAGDRNRPLGLILEWKKRKMMMMIWRMD
jgi:hypothetical protein